MQRFSRSKTPARYGYWAVHSIIYLNTIYFMIIPVQKKSRTPEIIFWWTCRESEEGLWRKYVDFCIFIRGNFKIAWNWDWKVVDFFCTGIIFNFMRFQGFFHIITHNLYRAGVLLHDDLKISRWWISSAQGACRENLRWRRLLWFKIVLSTLLRPSNI